MCVVRENLAKLLHNIASSASILCKWPVWALNWHTSLSMIASPRKQLTELQANTSFWFDFSNSQHEQQSFMTARAFLMCSIDKTPRSLSKPYSFRFGLTNLGLPQEPQSPVPTDSNKGTCPRSLFSLLSALCLDFPMWPLEACSVSPKDLWVTNVSISVSFVVFFCCC